MSKKMSSATSQVKGSKGKEVNVLFQKLGASWFAFSEVNGEIIYTALPEGIDPRTTELELYDVIEEHIYSVASLNKKDSELIPF
jgi:hypothetical protein